MKIARLGKVPFGGFVGCGCGCGIGDGDGRGDGHGRGHEHEHGRTAGTDMAVAHTIDVVVDEADEVVVAVCCSSDQSPQSLSQKLCITHHSPQASDSRRTPTPSPLKRMKMLD